MKHQFSITPPLELVGQLKNTALLGSIGQHDYETRLIMVAYAAGADWELKVGIEWWSIQLNCTDQKHLLPCFYEARRPKPPSLRQQACDALDTYVYGNPDQDDKVRTYNIIRQVLETLSND